MIIKSQCNEVAADIFFDWKIIEKVPYFNDLSAWSKARNAGTLRAFLNPLLLV